MRCECGRPMKNHEVEYYNGEWGIEKFCDLCDMGIFEGGTLDGSSALENAESEFAPGFFQKLYLADYAEREAKIEALSDEAFAWVGGTTRLFPHHAPDGTVEVERVREGIRKVMWMGDRDPMMKTKALAHLDGHLKEWMRRGVLDAYGTRSRMFPEARGVIPFCAGDSEKNNTWESLYFCAGEPVHM